MVCLYVHVAQMALLLTLSPAEEHTHTHLCCSENWKVERKKNPFHAIYLIYSVEECLRRLRSGEKWFHQCNDGRHHSCYVGPSIG